MNKKLGGAICLVAGTSIGAGILALPMSLAKLGILGGTILMIGCWLLSYGTALINLELNLRAKNSLDLGGLGKYYGSPFSQWFGSTSLMFLCYGLICAYISGTGSALDKMSLSLGYSSSPTLWAVTTTGLTLVILLYGAPLVLQLNKWFFYLLLGSIFGLILLCLKKINFAPTSLTTPLFLSGTTYLAVLPILFTSFGFQVIFHTLSAYLEMDKLQLKKAFFWGSFIPCITYLLWTHGITLLLKEFSPSFYERLLSSPVSVGDLITELGYLMGNTYLQGLFWAITLFALVTSLWGVSLSLKEQIRTRLNPQEALLTQNSKAGLLALIPCLLITLLCPEIFIHALGFAGMALAIIAIVLPLYLLSLSDKTTLHTFYPTVNKTWFRWSMGGMGVLIFAIELYSFF